MSDPTPTQENPEAKQALRERIARITSLLRLHGGAFRVVGVLIIALSVWWLIWLAGGEAPKDVLRNFIVASILFVAVCLTALWHERRWRAPSAKLLELIDQIRAGEAPIGSLHDVGGQMLHIAEAVRKIFHDGRSCERAVAELHAEMSQRVAGRTDALERVIGSLRQQATRDPLTGLFNRRLLDQQLPELIEKCRAQQADLAVLMIDIDHFKHLNDTLGHAAGDELLRSIAQIIRSSLREQDTAYRCGGDEFVITLPGADSNFASVATERLKSLVEGMTRTLKVASPPRLSIGVSQLSSLNDPTPQKLLRQADAMLYRLKYARKRAAKAAAVARSA